MIKLHIMILLITIYVMQPNNICYYPNNRPYHNTILKIEIFNRQKFLF